MFSRKYNLAVIILTTLMFNTGCTVLGFILGSNMDKRIAERDEEQQRLLNSVHESFRKSDSTGRNKEYEPGFYTGPHPSGILSYAEVYDLTRISFLSEVVLPVLYDTLIVNKNQKTRSVFLGFEKEGMLLRPINLNNKTLVPYNSIVFLENTRGEDFAVEKIKSLYKAGKIPTFFYGKQILLHRTDGKDSVPDQQRTYHWLAGTLIGITVDCAILVILVSIAPNKTILTNIPLK